MLRLLRYSCLLLCCITFTVFAFGQKKLNSSLYQYTLTVPDSLMETTEPGNDSEKTFYDNVSGVVMMVTGRAGIFENASGYMNCSKKNLETELKDYQGDSTLRLISCDQSKHYSKEVVILHFETKALPEGFNRCMMYFVHRSDKEVQFSFMYDKENDKTSVVYIEKIMQTLQLP